MIEKIKAFFVGLNTPSVKAKACAFGMGVVLVAAWTLASLPSVVVFLMGSLSILLPLGYLYWSERAESGKVLMWVDADGIRGIVKEFIRERLIAEGKKPEDVV